VFKTKIQLPTQCGIDPVRYSRGINKNPPPGSRNGYVTAYAGISIRVPYVVAIEDDSKRRARYSFTWRGIKRERAREYSIGAGEYLIIDLDTDEVLAVKRRFKISGHDKNTPSRIWWGNARPCDSDIRRKKGRTSSLIPINLFVKKILKPISGINDQYIPKHYQYLINEEKK